VISRVLLSNFSKWNILVNIDKNYFDGQIDKDDYDNLISE